MANYLSIRSKLLLLLIISGLAAALALSVIGYLRSDSALRAAVWDQLVAIRETKKADIQRYLKSQEREFAVFASEAQLRDAIPAFRAAFAEEQALAPPSSREGLVHFYDGSVVAKLPKPMRPLSADALLPTETAALRLQDRYIVRNPNPPGERERLEQPPPAAGAVGSYDEVHRRFHAHFVDMMEQLGMYDLFLIDDQTGEVLYTVEKESDFASNLETGPLRNSNLARAFRTIRDRPDDQRGVVFIDFEHYLPSQGAPAAFLAAPIYSNGDKMGVVAGQVSIDELNASLTSSGHWADEGLGQTGEVYLVGDDGYARSDSRFLVEDKKGYIELMGKLGVADEEREALDASGHSILTQHFATEAVDRALSGDSGTDVIDDYRGVEVLSAYSPIDFGGKRWAIIAEKDASEALGPLHELRKVFLFATGAIAIAITIFALLSARAFVAPLTRLQEAVDRLTSGDTHFTIEVKGDDEFAQLGKTFNGMMSEIERRNGVIEAKTAEYAKLLRNVLPDAVADRVSGGELIVADTFENVSVVYAVLGGIEAVQRDLSAGTMITLMNELIDAFDDAAERHGVEKIKTLGDAYLAACGLSTPRLDHRQRSAAFALEMQNILRRFNEAKGLSLTLGIGIADGEVDAGIIGRRRFVYEILGDCVSEARRLALSDDEVAVRMTESVRSVVAGQGYAGVLT
jgi:class 3 adenylate cyclase